jgi:hypothetical protein
MKKIEAWPKSALPRTSAGAVRRQTSLDSRKKDDGPTAYGIQKRRQEPAEPSASIELSAVRGDVIDFLQSLVKEERSRFVSNEKIKRQSPEKK